MFAIRTIATGSVNRGAHRKMEGRVTTTKRKTLLEQYQEMQGERQMMAEHIVAKAIGPLPSVVYEVGPPGRNYEPQEWIIEKIGAKDPMGTWFDKRPTRKVIEAMKAAPPVAEQDVYIHVQNGKGWSTAISLEGLENGRWSFNRDEIERKAEAMREKYVAKEGEFNCKHCNRATDEAKKVRGTIIARQYPNMRATFDFCSQECHSHHQMAHEG